jgi:2-dehydropantoate 2-reductase
MRFLIVGAGALGGYFGGRLLEAKRDVTFLLRPRRAAELDKTGLVIRSRFGDINLPPPPHIFADKIRERFDVVIVACKAFDLEQTMESFAPAVESETAILPLLNGMRHLDQLAARFGKQHVLGGQCMISAALDQNGTVLHLNDTHALAFGEQDGAHSARVEALALAFSGAGFDAYTSKEILQEMWEKWVFIASAASITCLMRATIGDIVSAGAADLAVALLDECGEVAASNGFAPRQAAIERGRAILSVPGSPLTASMFKDIERGAPIEADHIVGDLLLRSALQTRKQSLLRIAYAHLKAYEARRTREGRLA